MRMKERRKEKKKKVSLWGKYRSKKSNKIFDANGLGEYLKVKKNTIYIWVSGKRIPYVKIGSRTLFLKKEIDRWLQDRLVMEKF